MDSWLKHYIPAGCLRMRANGDDDLPPEAWITSYLEDWAFLIRHNDLAINHEVLLPDAAQTALLGSSVLVPFVDLFNARWIQISYSHGIIRVYIFPHDVDRRSIVRAGDAKLSKSLASLLRQLDYSPDTWNGTPDAVVWNHPATDTDRQYVVDEDCSLLERFNQLPSPEPQLDLITKGSFNAYALQGIMESSLSGLHTTLFAHQRRSAAVMLQREVEPGHVVDPRLRRAVDQTNQPWYFDTHTGLVLKEPRLYDQVSGGILAEEMGTGKTLICLALILATKDVPTEAPDALMVASSIRRRTGSLLDMAAAAVNRYSFPWKDYLASDASDSEKFYPRCVRALVSKENRAYYELGNPLVEIRRGGRIAAPKASAQRIYLSSVSLIIVPNNLVTQWELEISKHTTGLKCLTMTESQHDIPPVSVLLGYDIILFSQARFERIERTRTDADGRPVAMHCPLEHMRFKRCVVDEGHKLGSAKGSAWKSDLMRGLGRLQIAARWVVTGTPSRGLYSVQGGDILRTENKTHSPEQGGSQAVSIQEREDLQRIGSIASKFLNVRPWSNTREEVGDTPANWNVYVLQPKHHNKSYGRIDCLKTTLESLIIRNRLSDVSHHLPLVHEKIVVLDGSFQDKLSLNLFSMMIIFNSVQSQRTDQDYFFHPRQRKAVDQLVSNLRQASFFGGVFFSVEEIKKSLETAQSFLKEEKVSLSPEDHQLLESAIEFGNLAVENQLKTVSALYHSMPLYIDHFPGGKGKHWSLDDADTGTDEPICTDASLVKQLQKTLNPCIDAPTSLKVMIDSGQLDLQGDVARERVAREAAVASDAPVTSKGSLAGNTLQGIDRHDIKKANVLLEASRGDVPDTNTTSIEIAEPLAKTRIISTVSSKLTYLIDCITKYQEEEQIIVFYDSDNVAWYLAGVLEILHIQHLIYSRTGLNAKRRAQYVSTFTHNPKFRVLLMDISQAAFGLDMRSASLIYFISPVLNPQVEAQAIGRARRISQHKPVTVETLVLRGSIEEFMVERRKDMTQSEHRRIKNILDDKPTHDWILNARIIPMPHVDNNFAQTARLKLPQFVFGRGFGRDSDPDADLILDNPTMELGLREPEAATGPSIARTPVPFSLGGLKRFRSSTPAPGSGAGDDEIEPSPAPKKKKTVRVAFADDT